MPDFRLGARKLVIDIFTNVLHRPTALVKITGILYFPRLAIPLFSLKGYVYYPCNARWWSFSKSCRAKRLTTKCFDI